ncbi:DNA-directed RNA polymerase III subunit RPC7 isoform X2 [Tyto alba]|uniref:DNA-directed RNA polymerase III subunit RPC7 isoform X2 n=1 Tax=Tyto alba TaxID=56313 RepID=UPI001403BCCC|nr:DNA-directed RNA polymerase III subunit RPC7 isoform X2 [Tyto alba]
MAGRGRGRAVFTFNIEAIGFAKGAALPDSVSEAPPLYPSTENKPVPLKAGEDEDYMLAVKQEFRGTLKTMPYFLTVEHHEVIERYRKKYQDSEKKDASWSPDWRIFPREIKPNEKTKKGTKPKKAKISKPKSNLDVLKKIEELEEKDNEDKKSEDEKEETKDKEDEDDEKGEESEEDDEEHEEENDYIASYFEDGDDFDAASDDNMDEATY